MKASEFREMSRTELEQTLHEKHEELSRFRLRLETRQVDNPLQIREIRRDLARIQTVLREDAIGLRPLPGGASQTESEG